MVGISAFPNVEVAETTTAIISACARLSGVGSSISAR
jgi:hypothetical protein